MIEPFHKNQFEALKNASARHRSQMQGAWEQAGIDAAFESVRQAHLARKAKRSKSTSISVQRIKIGNTIDTIKEKSHILRNSMG